MQILKFTLSISFVIKIFINEMMMVLSIDTPGGKRNLKINIQALHII